MKGVLIFTLALISLYCYGQDLQVEKAALSFYVDSLYDQDTRVMSNGRIYDQESPALYYVRYLTCKIDSEKRKRRYDNEVLDSLRGIYTGLAFSEISYQWDTSEIQLLTLAIEPPLVLKRKHKYQRLRGGVIGLVRNLGDSFNGERYYLEVHRSIKVENEHFVKISQTKKDLEYGRDFYFRLDNSGSVKDWCESGWIQ